MRRIYFIDSENVGDNWISLLSVATPEDEILVFYTAKSPHMNYKNLVLLKKSEKEVVFIECCEGNNALDFQLCTDLGYRIHSYGECDFIIVSNDTGYDAVVKYWRRANVQVKRIQGKACAQEKERTCAQEKERTFPQKKERTESAPVAEVPSEVAEAPVPAPAAVPVVEAAPAVEVVPVAAAASAEAPAAPAKDPMDERAKEILYIIGKDNLQDLHESLKQIYGEKGKAYYDAFKSNSYNAFLAKHEVLSLSQKLSLYCSIVFEMSEQKPYMPEDFPQYVADVWGKKKNLNSFRAALQGKYGKDKCNTYYAIIKAHVKILDKLK